jgi:hypothetical protein
VKVAVLFSETGDIYLDNYGTAGAAKRALYITLTHSQLALDVVTEEDLVDGTLDTYAALYVAHTYVNDAASGAVAKWVAAGGTVISMVSGGLRNQANATNNAFAQLLGLSSDDNVGVYTGTRSGVDARVDFIKQDLAFAEIIDTVTAVGLPSFPRSGGGDGTVEESVVDTPASIKSDTVVVGEKAIFTAPTDAVVLATFNSDGKPAAYARKVGAGKAVFFGFHIGLAYFFPAIPKLPVARGSTDESFNHWVPTEFDPLARTLAVAPLANIVGASPVLSTEPRVDIGVLAAAGKGTVIPITNWAGASKQVNLTLQFPCKFEAATLASGAALKVSKTPTGNSIFGFELDVADAIILR